jgi:hypothetical protein
MKYSKKQGLANPMPLLANSLCLNLNSPDFGILFPWVNTPPLGAALNLYNNLNGG